MPKGKDLLLECLVQEGVKYIFGNPGTTEAPLVASLASHPQIEYILALHEGVAVGIADAYALATGHVGVVNLHVAPGLGNGLGMLFNAFIGNTPLLVTAGQQDTRMRLREPLLAHDLVGMAAPVTKWSAQAERADELPLLLHRALKVAKEAPSGPVFVALPINVLEEESAEPVLPPSKIFPRSAADPAAIQGMVELLLQSSKPVVLFGEDVFRSGAQEELVAVAEFLGAPVWTVMIPTGVGFPMNHPQFRGELPDTHSEIRECLGQMDTVLMVGGDFFREVFFTPDNPWPDDTNLIQFESFPRPLAKNFPVRLGMVADLRMGLRDLKVALASSATDSFRAESEARREELARLKVEEQRRRAMRVEERSDLRPMDTACLMAELRAALPPNVVIVDEALTAAPDLMHTFLSEHPGDYYGSRGGGIGQGLPGALGCQLAHPDRPVVAISGDGSALYSIQALWTAAHYGIPAVFVILNNRSYRILKSNMDRYRSLFGSDASREYPLTDLTEPIISFVSLAQGFGVPGQLITEPEEIGPAVEKAFATEGPYLLDVLISRGPTEALS